MVIVMKIFNKIFKPIPKELRKKIFKTLKILCISLPLIMMDIITRLFGYKIDICSIWEYGPNIFTLCFVVLFVSLSINFNNKIGKRIYLGINIFFLIMFLVNNVYFSMTNTFFNFHLLNSTKEGLPYILDAIKSCNIWVYISALFIICLIILGYKSIPNNNKNKYSLLLFCSIWCLIIHFIAPISLGASIDKLSHEAWLNKRNNYISFTDSGKSMKVSGLYEYIFRDFYITYLKPTQKITPEEVTFLDEAFKDNGTYNNKYSGIFNNKNLIFVQLEGIDDWVISMENTPTLYKMMGESYNFVNHYSYYSGGGSTFNSELAVNTGFITPLSYVQNPFMLNKNEFPNSMANIFKNNGYIVNAFHMNSGEFYSRTENYKNWGYDNYYGLIEVDNYENDKQYLDRELILNEKFNKLLFPTDKKFVDYIITYSTHMPFSTSSGVCKILSELDDKPVYLSEESCVKKQAQETDYMMKLLLQELERKNLINDTIIVLFTDHYLYTLNNKNILSKYKDTSSNLINHTPFFIWGYDIEATTINEVTSQIDILPTVLNLFGLYDNPKQFIGGDALDDDYEGIVFFSDYSWYDGNVYVVDGVIKDYKDKISVEELDKKNKYISYIARKNDLALKFNYFKK